MWYNSYGCMPYSLRKAMEIWHKSCSWWKKEHLFSGKGWKEAYTITIEIWSNSRRFRIQYFVDDWEGVVQCSQEGEELHFSLVGKPKVILTSTNLHDFPTKVRIFLDEYANIIVEKLPNDLPNVRSIGHHIDLIPATNLSNKESYRVTPQENEEIKQ